MMDLMVKQRLVDATDALARITGAALGEPEALTAILRLADELTSVAVHMLADGSYRDAITASTGLPPEVLVGLEARRTRWEARDLVAAADVVRLLPRTASLIEAGVVSPSQLRGIARLIHPLRAAQREQVDQLVASRASGLASAEPDQLVGEVEDLVCRLREDLLVKREDRQIERGFLALQQRLDGSGSLYGEADAESFATITTAVDALAARPSSHDHEADGEPSSRARQRLDALVGLCEAALSGDRSGSRPRARLLAVLDVTGMDRLGICEGARVLAHVAGGPLRLSRLATQILACDADITPIVFSDGQPIGIGNTSPTIPEKLRAAVIARDGGCRFPGCRMPAAWTDVHHIRAREDGGDATINNLLLLCRRCHRRVHRYRWKLALEANGAASFAHRGKRYTTQPRARPPTRV